MMFEEFQNGSLVITEHGPKSDLIDTVALIAGWISFASWSACLMPQIYSNHRRKSASGLSFDFLGLNVTGFSFYLTFTSCLYFVKSFQDAYREVSGPEAELPVRLSDVALGTLCLSTTLVLVFQSFIYPSDGQRLSRWTKVFIATTWSLAAIQLVLIFTTSYSPLNFIYYLSYVKLMTTFRYVVQAWFTFCRKSTQGFSIFLVLLDLSGGISNLTQVFLDVYNYDDWNIITGNLTKFGMSVVSMVIISIYLVQHFCLYNVPRFEP